MIVENSESQRLSDNPGTDMLLFRQTPEGANEYAFNWNGPWPPPERMTIVRGQLGYTAYDTDDPPVGLADDKAAAEKLGWKFLPYRRYSASEQSEPAPADEHWFRGALYTPEV